MEIDIDTVGLDGLIKGFDEAPAAIEAARVEAMSEALEMTRIAIQFRTPVRTGKLMSAWETRQDIPGTKGVIFNRVDYAAPVEFGSRRHTIVPRFKKALFWPGARHPVKKVTIPARAGRHMGSRGATASIPGIIQTFTRAMKRAVIASFRLH